MKTKVKAIFKGSDGSLGYIANHEYEFIVKEDNDKFIHIESKPHIDKSGKTFTGCVYGSIIAFLNNWDNIRRI
ncbi:MAG: hypothetical protein WC428_01775 [Candidatus Paceibacterota bacterium]